VVVVIVTSVGVHGGGVPSGAAAEVVVDPEPELWDRVVEVTAWEGGFDREAPAPVFALEERALAAGVGELGLDASIPIRRATSAPPMPSRTGNSCACGTGLSASRLRLTGRRGPSAALLCSSSSIPVDATRPGEPVAPRPRGTMKR